jgi:hypothetical protein
MTAADLGRCVFAPDRFQCHPRLEIRRVTLPCDLAHLPSLSQVGISLTTGPNSGDHLSYRGHVAEPGRSRLIRVFGITHISDAGNGALAESTRCTCELA